MCVCERERESVYVRERESVCVCVCVCEREIERESSEEEKAAVTCRRHVGDNRLHICGGTGFHTSSRPAPSPSTPKSSDRERNCTRQNYNQPPIAIQDHKEPFMTTTTPQANAKL